MKQLRDRVVVITGAGGGIGRALALAFAQEGSHLALSDINEAGLEETRSLVEQAMSSCKVHTQRLDVADREAFYAYAEAVAAHFGGVHVVINNAGVTLRATIEEMELDDLAWLMGINFWGVVYGTKAFLPYLKEAEEAHIVNLSSIFGIITVPTQGAYHAAKFAVRGWTETLQQELRVEAPHVFASSVHPGGVKTQIAASARMGGGGKFAASGDKIVRDFEKMARTTPAQAAQIILRGVKRRQKRILVGPDARLFDRVQRWMPVRYQWLVARFMGIR